MYIVQCSVYSVLYSVMFTVYSVFFKGTSDHTPFLCTEAALNFYKRCGGFKGIKSHTEDLLDWAQQASNEQFLLSQLDLYNLPL